MTNQGVAHDDVVAFNTTNWSSKMADSIQKHLFRDWERSLPLFIKCSERGPATLGLHLLRFYTRFNDSALIRVCKGLDYEERKCLLNDFHHQTIEGMVGVHTKWITEIIDYSQR
jgi:hypothetical protein